MCWERHVELCFLKLLFYFHVNVVFDGQDVVFVFDVVDDEDFEGEVAEFGEVDEVFAVESFLFFEDVVEYVDGFFHFGRARVVY